MIDQAGIRMAQGCTFACERISGVNDNMIKSHYHNYYELYFLEEGETIIMANKKEICFLCGKTRSEVNQLLKGKFGYVHYASRRADSFLPLYSPPFLWR